MSHSLLITLTVLWFVIVFVGIAFTLLNWRRARLVRRIADTEDTDEEVLHLAHSHLRNEQNRLIVFAFFLLMGAAVIIRQRGWISRAVFDVLFYGGLEAAATTFSIKAILAWFDQRRLYRLDRNKRQREEMI